MSDKEFSELVKRYGEEAVLNGYEDFDKHLRERKKDLENLHHLKAKQDTNHALHNKLFNKQTSFDFNGHLKEHDKKFDVDELSIAKKHGFKVKEDEKEELTKEEKIAQAKENFKDTETANLQEQTSDKKTEFDLSKKQDEFVETIKGFRENQKPQNEDDSQETERQAFLAEMESLKEKEKQKER